ncbi:conserved Plasmodium protein, unknown function [Plasmodium ovale]|uniref:Uncharacterized protein n=1 Tax=Plasmodium ovale TaxID=36330 RepID=A0A1C3KXT2_PLAOA|nr:conserved Plasmodium protein, unknown function [Plasmodium ovale]
MMKELRSSSTISSGAKRKFDETGLGKTSHLANKNSVDAKNGLNKDKRRSVSLSNDFVSVNSFSKYGDSFKLVSNNVGKGNISKPNERCEDNHEEVDRQMIRITGEIPKNNKNKNGKFFHLERFKNLMFKKSLLYKIRCLGHNSTWLLELSKGKGKKFSLSGSSTLFTKLFYFYQKIIKLFYKKRYKEAYLRLNRLSTDYCCSNEKRNILCDNFFQRKRYNLRNLIRLSIIPQKSVLGEKINFKMSKRGNYFFKKKTQDESHLSVTKKVNTPFSILMGKQNEMMRKRIVKKGGNWKYNGQEKEKKRNMLIHCKFSRYETYVNFACNQFLQSDEFILNGCMRRGEKKKKKRRFPCRCVNKNMERNNQTCEYLLLSKSKKKNNMRGRKVPPSRGLKHEVGTDTPFRGEKYKGKDHPEVKNLKKTEGANSSIRLNIENAIREEVLLYIVRYLKRVKKIIKFDTYLYLLLSTVYYDLKKFNKSFLCARKSIKRDYFNYISWMHFNELAAVEVVTRGGRSRGRKRNGENYHYSEKRNSERRYMRTEKISKKEENVPRRKTFRENSKKISKLCRQIFENHFFLYGKRECTDVVANYGKYIHLNPLQNLNQSFFFKKRYFVSTIFSRDIKEEWTGDKRRLTLFEKYKIYTKKHKFRNNIMTLFGFAHFCSLNRALYKDAIKVYEHLGDFFRNNMYVSSELAKLYYYRGQVNKSAKCFSRIKRICNRNRILKRETMDKCLICYVEKKRKSVTCPNNRKVTTGGEHSPHNHHLYGREWIENVNENVCKKVKTMWVPKYFTNKFVYFEILVNIFFLKKDFHSIFLLVHNYQKEGKMPKGRRSKRRRHNDESCCYALGKYYSLGKNYKKAIFYFKKAIRKDQFHLFSYLGLAQEYTTLGNLNSAVFILIKVINVYFNNPNAWFSLAKCLEYEGNYPFSIFSYKNAIYLEDNKLFYFFLANLYLKKEDMKNYIETLKDGWMAKKNETLFLSHLVHTHLVKLKKEKEELLITYNEKNENNTLDLSKNIKKDLYYYRKKNDCYKWCVRYLTYSFRKWKKEEKFSSFSKHTAGVSQRQILHDRHKLSPRLESDYQVELANGKFLLRNVNHILNFGSTYEKSTSYFYFIHRLRNASSILYDAIYYLANYFFFHKKFQNAARMFQILWDAGGPYSGTSFRSFRQSHRGYFREGGK